MKTLIGQFDDFSGSKFGTGEAIKQDSPGGSGSSQPGGSGSSQPGVKTHKTQVEASKFGIPYADEAASTPKPTVDVAQEQITDSGESANSEESKGGFPSGLILLAAAAGLFFFLNRKKRS